MTRFVRMDRLLLSRLIDEDREGMQAELARLPDTIDKVMLASSYNLAYAMIDGAEVPIGGALLPHFFGHAEAVCFVSANARARQIVQAVRWAKCFLDRRQRHPQFRRVQMYVRTNQPWSMSFPEALGFHCEGLHEAWDVAGHDYWCFARIRR